VDFAPDCKPFFCGPSVLGFKPPLLPALKATPAFSSWILKGVVVRIMFASQVVDVGPKDQVLD